MKKLAMRALMAGAVLCLGFAGSANAYLFTVQTANQAGVQFQAANPATGFNSGGAITATFTYSGPLDFSNTAAQNNSSTGDLNSDFFTIPANITGYSGSGTLGAPANANFSTLTTFLASSGSASNYQYGSLYTIDLGVLPIGTVLTITHDDGASIYQLGSRIGSTTSGPTTVVTESVALTSTAATTLYYARENGSPSVLKVSVGPEPATLAILGAGLVGVGLVRRRRAKKAANVAAA